MALVVQDEAVYLSGLTSSPTGIATSDGPQPTAGGDADGIVSRFNKNGALAWGSYYGGTDWDQLSSIDADTAGNIYCGGFTISASGIATAGAHQVSYSGGYGDGFLFRIKDCSLPAIADTILGPLSPCSGTTATYRIPGATDLLWLLPSGCTGSGAADSTVVVVATSGLLRAVPINSCGVGDTISLSVTAQLTPAIPVISRNGNQLSIPAVYSSYQWSRDNVTISGATSYSYTATVGGSYTVTVGGSNGCMAITAPLLVNFTGIEAQLARYGVSIFPNPVAADLHIRSNASLIANITDVNGRSLQRKPIKSGENTLDVSALSTGVYLLEFYDMDGLLLDFVKLIKWP